MNNYKTMSSDEVEFVAKTMTSLFLAKSNFNINNLPTVYEMLENMETDDILKCMQIANKETANIYNDFIEKTDNLISIQNVIRENVLNQFKEDTFISEEQKQNFISSIERNSFFNSEHIENIYNGYVTRYERAFKKMVNNIVDEITTESNVESIKETKVDDSEEINTDTSSISDEENVREQMSLFAPREEELANKICDIFNSFDTKYQNTFEINNVELQKWEHIKSKKRNLSIILTSSLIGEFADRDNSFTYFNSDKTDKEFASKFERLDFNEKLDVFSEIIIRYDNETYFNEKTLVLSLDSKLSGYDIAKQIQNFKN